MRPVKTGPRRGPALLPLMQDVGKAGLIPKGSAVKGETRSGSGPRHFVIGYIDPTKLPVNPDTTNAREAAKDRPADTQPDSAIVDNVVSEARAQIARYAAQNQLALGNIYVDYPGTGGSQFRVLMIGIERYNPEFVLVPDLDHVDSPTDVDRDGKTRREQIEAHTGATVRPVLGESSGSEAVQALINAAAGRSANWRWTVGYVDAADMMRAQLDDHMARIREYADRHQLSLLTTYVDQPGGEDGFQSLRARIEVNGAIPVLVTTLDHLDPAAVDRNGRPTDETRHQYLQRLAVELTKVFP